MRYVCWVVSLVVSFYSLKSAVAATSNFADFLRQPETQAELDRLTQTPQSLNHVTLLHLGKNSLPVRRALLKSAQKSILVSVPYWFNDSTGTEMRELIEDAARKNPGLDYRVIEEWTSIVTGHGANEIHKDLEGHVLRWNSPTWQRDFSPHLLDGHMHDKMLVVDGKAMVVGGMNMSDEYLEGGNTAKGWHDTDLFIEGPAAQHGAEVILKIWQLAKYLRSDAHFPPFLDQEVKAFHNFFYNNVEDHDFKMIGTSQPPKLETYPVHIPILDLLNNPIFFPVLPPPDENAVPVRLIYDNPLIDRDVTTHKHYSKLLDTLTYLFDHAQESVFISTPYLTPDKAFADLLKKTAKRIKVYVMTNSAPTHDVGLKPYRAAASHYANLIDSGVEIREWLGNGSLVELEKRENCAIAPGQWSGQTLHSKIVVIDGQVAFVGSNNLNNQSLNRNGEVMAMVTDPKIASQVKQIFINDFGFEGSNAETVQCGGRVLQRPVRTEQITKENLPVLKRRFNIPDKPLWKYPFGF